MECKGMYNTKMGNLTFSYNCFLHLLIAIENAGVPEREIECKASAFHQPWHYFWKKKQVGQTKPASISFTEKNINCSHAM